MRLKNCFKANKKRRVLYNKTDSLRVRCAMFNLLKKQPLKDIFVNVLLPLIIGKLLYYINPILPAKGFIINQVPDGCWAYALASSILIIWDRQIKQFWIFLAFTMTVFFEILQSLHFIAGTGDLRDVLTYFLTLMLVLICNKSFKRKFITLPHINLIL